MVDLFHGILEKFSEALGIFGVRSRSTLAFRKAALRVISSRPGGRFSFARGLPAARFATDVGLRFGILNHRLFWREISKDNVVERKFAPFFSCQRKRPGPSLAIVEVSLPPNERGYSDQ
jgi:hypothetical protein